MVEFRGLILVLKDVGQISLAYLTAATHGFNEEAQQLKEELLARGQNLPPVDPNARLLVPPPPIKQVYMRFFGFQSLLFQSHILCLTHLLGNFSVSILFLCLKF